MKTKTILHRSLWLIFILLLTACNLRAYYAPPTPTMISSPIETATLQSSATKTPMPADTTPLQSFTLNGLCMAYIMDGNLYMQESGGQPIQLTNSGQDRRPMFSDDGQKIVFFRGAVNQKNAVYSINADSSQEQVLVTSDSLMALGLGYDQESELGDLAFVPG